MTPSRRGERLRAEVVPSLIVGDREEREREEKHAAGAVYRDAAGRMVGDLLDSVSEEQQVEPGIAAAKVFVEREPGDRGDERGEGLLNRVQSCSSLRAHRHRQRAAGQNEANRHQRKYRISAGRYCRDERKIQSPARQRYSADDGYSAACYDGHPLEESDQRAVTSRGTECNCGVRHVTR